MNEFKGTWCFQIVGIIELDLISKERLMRGEWLVVLENMEKMGNIKKSVFTEEGSLRIRIFLNFLGMKIALPEDSNDRRGFNLILS